MLTGRDWQRLILSSPDKVHITVNSTSCQWKLTASCLTFDTERFFLAGDENSFYSVSLDKLAERVKLPTTLWKDKRKKQQKWGREPISKLMKKAQGLRKGWNSSRSLGLYELGEINLLLKHLNWATEFILRKTQKPKLAQLVPQIRVTWWAALCESGALSLPYAHSSSGKKQARFVTRLLLRMLV